ncbi:MAG: hypothetical protein P8P30_08900 [Rickettsiales bacterium]|nr:hypothetical protein [Rickettsiales bacterium]
MPTIIPPTVSNNSALLKGVSANPGAGSATQVPPGIIALPAGTVLRGNIAQIDGRGNAVLSTAKGDVSLQTELPIKLGSEVSLRLTTATQGIKAKILSINGATPQEFSSKSAQPRGQSTHVDDIVQTGKQSNIVKPGTTAAQSSQAQTAAARLVPASTEVRIPTEALTLRGVLLSRSDNLPQVLQQLPTSISLPIQRLEAGVTLTVKLVPETIQLPQPTTTSTPAAAAATATTPTTAATTATLATATLPANAATSGSPAITTATPTIPTAVTPNNAASVQTTALPAAATPNAALLGNPTPATQATVATTTATASATSSPATTVPAAAAPTTTATPTTSTAAPTATAATSTTAPVATATTTTTPAQTAASATPNQTGAAATATPTAAPTPAATAQVALQTQATSTQVATPTTTTNAQATSVPAATSGAAAPASPAATATPAASIAPTTAAVTVPAAIPVAAQLAQGQLTATVIGQEQSGDTVVKTALGAIKVSIPSGSGGQANLPVGTTLTLQLQSINAPQTLGQAIAAQISSTPAPLSELSMNWRSLQETVELLAQVQPAIAAQVLENVIPKPGAKMASSMLFFLSALRGGDVGKWLGDDTIKILEQSNRGDLIRKLTTEFGTLRQFFTDSPSPNWQAAFVPVHDGTNWQQARMFLKKEPQGAESAEGGGTRFIMEVELTKMGPMQFDGLVRKRAKAVNFDLIIRSRNTLGDADRQNIRDIYQSSSELTGFKGGISFQVTNPFPVLPMRDILADAPDVMA